MEADSSRINLHKASSQAGRKTEDSRKARGIRSINNKKEVKKNKEVKNTKTPVQTWDPQRNNFRNIKHHKKTQSKLFHHSTYSPMVEAQQSGEKMTK